MDLLSQQMNALIWKPIAPTDIAIVQKVLIAIRKNIAADL
jgi:hypothetical protein